MALPETATPAPAVKTGSPTRLPRLASQKRFVITGIVLITLLAVAAGYWVAPQVLGVRLMSYESGNGYSLKVPQDYPVSTNSAGTSFVTRHDGVISSGIVITSEPVGLMIKEAKDGELQDQLKAAASGMLADMLERKYQVQDLTFRKVADKNGNKAYRASADLLRDGKTGGAELAIVVTDERLYAVSVMSEKANAKLLKKAGTILDSFALNR